jgi:hypothetical protein
MCHADIWAVAELSAWREPLCVDLPNVRSWIYGSFNASPAVIELERRLRLLQGMTPARQKEDEMERTFLLPNGVQAGVTTTEPPSRSPTVRFGKDVPVLFYVSNAEALRRLMLLLREEYEAR